MEEQQNKDADNGSASEVIDKTKIDGRGLRRRGRDGLLTGDGRLCVVAEQRRDARTLDVKGAGRALECEKKYSGGRRATRR